MHFRLLPLPRYFRGIAAAAGLCFFIFACSEFVRARSRTVIGGHGIRCRVMAGWYEYRWEQIANVACRAVTSRGVTGYSVVLITTDGDRIPLGTPRSGGVLADPEFPAKFRKIRGAWQQATGNVGPETDTTPLWTRARLLAVGGICSQIMAVAMILSVLSVFGPALAAHEGVGTRGVFTAELRNCPQPSCTWFGLFTADGQSRYVTLAAGAPFISSGGASVAAVDTGERDTVYPEGGGTSWEGPAIALVIAGACVLIALAGEIAIPLSSRRRRRQRARAGLARLNAGN